MAANGHVNGAESLSSIIDGISIDDFDGVTSRRKALASARSLVRRLETPIDSLWDLSHNYPALRCAIKVAKANQIFETLDEDGGRPKTTEELCKASLWSPDPVLISRMLRHMKAMDFIAEAGPDLWAPTRLTTSLRERQIFAEVEFAALFAQGFGTLPEYLQKTGYQEPKTQANGECNFSYMLGNNDSFFDYLAKSPDQQEIFSNFMSGYASQRGSWVDIFPTEKILEGDGLNDSTPLIVDMGGATGHDLGKFLQKHPESAGRLIYQDQKHVVEDAVKRQLPPPGLRPMAHDFFTPQPVEGAKYYYMHCILHDWPDKEAIQILQNLKPAMTKRAAQEQPKLLINDVVIPPTNANAYETSIDVLMMALCGSKERSEKEWTGLLEKAGYKVVELHKSEKAFEGVIECVVDDEEIKLG